MKMAGQTSCEYCSNYEYDEEYDEYICTVDLDEDELASLAEGRMSVCPFFRFDEEYRIVRKQN